MKKGQMKLFRKKSKKDGEKGLTGEGRFGIIVKRHSAGAKTQRMNETRMHLEN